MPAATYTLEVDWDGDGSFEGGAEDVSADWMSATISRGFADPLARMPQVGRADFVLKNAGQDYSPPLNAGALPRRQVRFTMDYGGTPAVLFRGFVEDIQPSSGPRLDRRAVLQCVDALALMDVESGRIPILESVYADEVIEDVVAAVYTPPATNYEPGKNRFPFSADRWTVSSGLTANGRAQPAMESGTAAQKIQDACASDWGRFFISKAGAPTFFNRHHMPLDASTELTLSDDMKRLRYGKPVTEVYNLVEVTCYPRSVGQVYEVLGRISQGFAPRIEAGATEVFSLSFRDPATGDPVGGKGVLTPVSGTDYTATDDEAGEGTDVTASVSASLTLSGDRAEVELENTSGAAVYIQTLQVRGYAVRAREPVTVRAEDSASQTAYQKRRLPIDAPLMSMQAQAQRLADYLLDVYKTPRNVVRGVELLANRSATFLAAARDLELLDRVVITESQTGLSGYAAHVMAMRHNIINKHQHWLSLDVETAYPVGTPFRLDTSTLNSGHVLIY